MIKYFHESKKHRKELTNKAFLSMKKMDISKKEITDFFNNKNKDNKIEEIKNKKQVENLIEDPLNYNALEWFIEIIECVCLLGAEDKKWMKKYFRVNHEQLGGVPLDLLINGDIDMLIDLKNHFYYQAHGPM